MSISCSFCFLEVTLGSFSVLDLCLSSTWNLRITERVFDAEVDEGGLIEVGVMGKVRFRERPIYLQQPFRKTLSLDFFSATYYHY